ncbi:LysR family transcriptional regulator [Tepidibacter formicigenes]|jgi:DNA-binding transcriptional LysR family regulator|uniref:DNA-binding transcriptional regulator, LysR family n=1 Tax=Tepidibacter formicigenes DSM 15518 TaxID=1123349 RepID=A0A1M6NIY4_9FIRM|nr:LysR family transcriptional regulator [Tepidibacter formicigenes]SHJ95623.1 DNA-binding transcriptional regulator, LysR family [Tepidibacter formicigenes DSM 15518]
MNLQYLKSFYITVKCNSISKAAKSLHLTQPGLSMQLQNLEKELGVNLLNRSNKGVELTEEGKVVFDYANTLLSIQGNIERDLKNLQQDQPQLMIGSCKSVGEYALPCSIYTFKQLHKEVDIHMEVNNSTKVIEKLRKHTINIGIIQYDPKANDILTQTIVSDELLLVGNCYDSPKQISIKELKEIPLILREKNSGTRYSIEKALQEKGIRIEDLNVIYDLNSPEAIKSSILSGKGFSFLPKLIIQQELKKHCIQPVTVDNLTIPFDYFVAYRKNYTFTKYEKMFVDFIISSKRGFC